MASPDTLVSLNPTLINSILHPFWHLMPSRYGKGAARLNAKRASLQELFFSADARPL